MSGYAPERTIEEEYDEDEITDDQYLAHCLDERSPADVLDSDQLLHSFQRFFQRGTSEDLRTITPASLRPTPTRPGTPIAQNASINSSGNQSDSDSASRSLGRSSSASGAKKNNRRNKAPSKSLGATPSNGSVTAPLDDRIVAFYSSQVSSPTRIHALSRITRGCLKAKQLPPETHQELWKVQSNIFSASSASESRFMRLYRGRKQIDQSQHKLECAGRLALVFLAHDIEITKARPFKLRPGQCRQQFAVLWLAEHLGVPADEIKEDWRRAQNYLKVLEACGPGSLLELGPSVSWYWEKSLTREDVDLWLNCRRECLPELEERAVRLNKIAAQVILNGMAAYGWTSDDFAALKVTSRLQKALTRHCGDLMPLPWSSNLNRAQSKGSRRSTKIQSKAGDVQASTIPKDSPPVAPIPVTNTNSYAPQPFLGDSTVVNSNPVNFNHCNPNFINFNQGSVDTQTMNPAAAQLLPPMGDQLPLDATGFDSLFNTTMIVDGETDPENLPDWNDMSDFFGGKQITNKVYPV